jgi:predicted 2-oxoglutarate/Fe(II)-dependent dioxygenase YbiX
MNPLVHLRQHILVQSHAVDAATLGSLQRYLQSASMHDSLVSNFEDDVPDDQVEWVVNKKVRDTQEVVLTADLTTQLNQIIDSCTHQHIVPFYNLVIRDWEPPHILHYGTNGHYIPHVDAETLYKDESELDWWEKTLDRDVSWVLFLNDDFTGGELVFPDLDLTIAPRAGTLVCFPSDHNYVHGVQPVREGHRFTLVTWMRVQGMPTLDEINRESLAAHHAAWPKQARQLPRVMKGSAS